MLQQEGNKGSVLRWSKTSQLSYTPLDSQEVKGKWIIIKKIIEKTVGRKKSLWQIQFARARAGACRQAYISITRMIEQLIHHTDIVENVEERRWAEGGRQTRKEVRTLHLNSICKTWMSVTSAPKTPFFNPTHGLIVPLYVCRYSSLWLCDRVCSLPLTSRGKQDY